MEQHNITRGYLRLTSGIALLILLVASFGAFYVTLTGQRHVIQSSHNAQMVDQLMVTLAEFSLAFDDIEADPKKQAAELALGRLRRSALVGNEALNALVVAHKNVAHSQDMHQILMQTSLNPIEEMRDVLQLANLAIDPGRSEGELIRVSALGSEMSRRLLPIYLRMAAVEASASQQHAKEQVYYALFAIVIGALGIFVAARFVHLPMERFVISAQADIEREQRRAETASEAKSSFLATMSHEIRTPLNGVMGLSELLQDTEKDPDRRRMLDMIVSSGHALLQTLNDVLDLSKIEAGKFELESEVFDARVVCEEVVGLFSAQAHAKGVVLTLDVVPTDGCWSVEGYCKTLRQALLNLVSNAIKFTDHGSVTVALRDQAATDVAGRRLELSVRDTGIGISPEAQTRIFDQFSQADSSTTTRYGGTGLGLAIVQQLSHAMNGDVSVTSTLGAGSTFVIDVPVVSRPMADSGQDAATEITRLSGRVLIADDNRVNLLVAEKMLMRLGCTVKKAANGIEAVSMFRTWQPDLILMDIRMPEMDGLAATRLIRSDPFQETGRSVPIVGLSANALTEHRDAGLAAGMDGYLTKPLKRSALVQELRKYLDAPGGPEPEKGRDL